MNRHVKKSVETSWLTALILMAVIVSCGPGPDAEQDAALSEFRKQVEEALPAVGTLTGIDRRGPVKVQLTTRAALGEFLEKSLEVEYPDGALRKRGRCFAEIGLLPRGYDLAGGLLDLLKQEAGAVYDPASETLIGIRDLPRERTRAVSDRMILSHELTHALQDRVIDIPRQAGLGLENIDYEYALRAVIEGMASGVMLAYAQDVALDRLPDLRNFWRASLAQAAGGAFSGKPRYLVEYLLSPYAEGGAFVQAWMRANPGKALEALLRRIPASSEQVLHFEKYAEGDSPAEIDLSGTRRILPPDWEMVYANTLGEFDLLQLFRAHPRTEGGAAGLAEGWDGCRFEMYRDREGGLVLVGSSTWDREEDAVEFSEGFYAVLAGSRSGDDFAVTRNGERVHFVIGSSDTHLRAAILELLEKAEPPGRGRSPLPGGPGPAPPE